MSDWRHGLSNEQKAHLRWYGFKTKKQVYDTANILCCPVCAGICEILDGRKKKK